jgi:hypothetical protein
MSDRKHFFIESSLSRRHSAPGPRPHKEYMLPAGTLQQADNPNPAAGAMQIYHTGRYGKNGEVAEIFQNGFVDGRAAAHPRFAITASTAYSAWSEP